MGSALHVYEVCVQRLMKKKKINEKGQGKWGVGPGFIIPLDRRNGSDFFGKESAVNGLEGTWACVQMQLSFLVLYQLLLHYMV